MAKTRVLKGGGGHPLKKRSIPTFKTDIKKTPLSHASQEDAVKKRGK